MNGFTRTDFVSANNVTPLLIIQNPANSELTIDEHCDKLRDHMGHPQDKTRANSVNWIMKQNSVAHTTVGRSPYP